MKHQLLAIALLCCSGFANAQGEAIQSGADSAQQQGVEGNADGVTDERGYQWEYSHKDRNYNGGSLSCGSDCNRYTEGQAMGCRIQGTQNDADIYVCRRRYQPSYQWRFEYRDRNYNGGEMPCSTRCDDWNIGRRKACHVPGTQNDADIYTCEESGRWP